MSIKLSVNINKFAVLRNSRGGNQPNILTVAQDIESFGANGITVHPRPDERHIKVSDLPFLKKIIKGEFNIEGNPTRSFMETVTQILPTQVTLVPDAPTALTSNSGWDTQKNAGFLKEITQELHEKNMRVSIFISPHLAMIEKVVEIGAERIEFYTGPFAKNPNLLQDYMKAAFHARSLGLAVNAGHDLSLTNLSLFLKKIPFIKEVSIGHALICEAIYYGLKTTIERYKKIIFEVNYETNH